MFGLEGAERVAGASSRTVTDALQKLRVASAESVRDYAPSLTARAIRLTLDSLERSGQVRSARLGVLSGDSRVWFLAPWEQEAKKVLSELEGVILKIVCEAAATQPRIQKHFDQHFPQYRRLGRMLLSEMVASGKLLRQAYPATAQGAVHYYPPQKLIQSMVMSQVRERGVVLPRELVRALHMSRMTVNAAILDLAGQGKISRFRAGGSVKSPVFAYCVRGYEAVAAAKRRKETREETRKRLMEARLKKSMEAFQKICAAKNLDPKTADLAYANLQKVIGAGWTIGRKRDLDSIALGVFFLTARSASQPISPRDIEDATGTADNRWLKTAQELKPLIEPEAPAPNPKPADYLETIMLTINPPPDNPQKAQETKAMLEKARRTILNTPQRLLMGRKPRLIAAAALYEAAEELKIEGYSQKRIAGAAGVSDGAVRNAISQLWPMQTPATTPSPPPATSPTRYIKQPATKTA